MDIRPEIGVQNPSWLDQPDLYRGSKGYSNYKHSQMYGKNPEDYKDELENRKEVAEEEFEHGWNEDYTDFQHGRLRPKTQAEIDSDKDDVERWLDMNNRMAWDDPASPMQRMNQPMASNLTDEHGNTSWKFLGDYMPAVSFAKALLDDETGGSFKDTLNNQSDGDRQEWLNNNHGGRGLGYMGQNKFPSATHDMAQRRANVQANARRIRGMS